jgi:hypothetical protein
MIESPQALMAAVDKAGKKEERTPDRRAREVFSSTVN